MSWMAKSKPHGLYRIVIFIFKDIHILIHGSLFQIFQKPFMSSFSNTFLISHPSFQIFSDMYTAINE